MKVCINFGFPFLSVYLLSGSCQLLIFVYLFPQVYTCLVNFTYTLTFFFTSFSQFFVDFLFYTEYTILLYSRLCSILTFYSIKSVYWYTASSRQLSSLWGESGVKYIQGCYFPGIYLHVGRGRSYSKYY